MKELVWVGWKRRRVRRGENVIFSSCTVFCDTRKMGRGGGGCWRVEDGYGGWLWLVNERGVKKRAEWPLRMTQFEGRTIQPTTSAGEANLLGWSGKSMCVRVYTCPMMRACMSVGIPRQWESAKVRTANGSRRSKRWPLLYNTLPSWIILMANHT